MRHILDAYCEASGQKINDAKSGILFSPSMRLNQTRKCLRVVNIWQNKGIGKYLGIPMEFQGSGKGTQWCSRNFLSLPKSAGGVGMRNIECLNQALLAKQAWRIVLGQDSIFCKGVRSLLYGVDLLSQNVSWKPGIESNLNIWNTCWVNGETPGPSAEALQLENAGLKDLSIKDLRREDGGWNERRVSAFGPVQTWVFALIVLPPWILGSGLSTGPHIWMFYGIWRSTVDIILKARDMGDRGDVASKDIGRGCDSLVREVRDRQPFYVIGGATSCISVKVMVDVGWKSVRNSAIGWIAYAHDGASLFTRSVKINAQYTLKAEALRLKDVLGWARKQGILHLEVSSDCLQLLLQLTRNEMAHHCTKGILDDMGLYFPYFHCLCFTFIPRRFNKIAHDLAMRAMSK
ncbi:uncharacterized protein LOC141617674 [Silene latifolia]|uniref:uncharacterized protein LOC141617674 n=1 Tax=Silene latifolia TaxID=37657 RepID=UPI003D7724FA